MYKITQKYKNCLMQQALKKAGEVALGLVYFFTIRDYALVTIDKKRISSLILVKRSGGNSDPVFIKELNINNAKLKFIDRTQEGCAIIDPNDHWKILDALLSYKSNLIFGNATIAPTIFTSATSIYSLAIEFDMEEMHGIK